MNCPNIKFITWLIFPLLKINISSYQVLIDNTTSQCKNELGNETVNLSKQTGSQEAFKSDTGDYYNQKQSQCQVTIWKIRPVNNQKEKLQG